MNVQNGRIETRIKETEEAKEKVTSLVCSNVTFLQTKKEEKESE